MVPTGKVTEKANLSNEERRRLDKEKVKKLRKSPDINRMVCMIIGTAKFYFETEAKMNYFWKGDKHAKGYKQILTDSLGKEYVDNLTVEIIKKESNGNKD